MIFPAADKTVIRCGVYVETKRGNKDTNNKDFPLTFSKRKP